MSFASDVKDEIIEKSELARMCGGMKECCIHAEMYGLFLFCRDFSASRISIKTEHEGVASLYASFIQMITGKKPKIDKSSAGTYKVSVRGDAERQKVLEAFGHTGSEITRRLNRANLEFDCCPAALIRGAFLSCGTITNPEKDYHLEFVVSHKVLCDNLKKLMNEVDIFPKYVLRKGVHVLYFKDSEKVEDLLTYMGAPDSSLEIMGTKMYKDMRNKVNRKMNFENANSSRAFDAAYKQIEAIRFIEKEKGLGYLPSDLVELAKLRLQNEDYSLKELGDELSEPISKSGVNHRLKRILKAAEELGWYE